DQPSKARGSPGSSCCAAMEMWAYRISLLDIYLLPFLQGNDGLAVSLLETALHAAEPLLLRRPVHDIHLDHVHLVDLLDGLPDFGLGRVRFYHEGVLAGNGSHAGFFSHPG